MNEKMIEAAIEGNFSQFSDMLKEELNRRVHELIESRIQDVTDDTWNVCESCDEDDVWDDEDVEDLYHDENDPYEDEEDEDLAEGDDHDTRELHLYATNHADLHRQRLTPIHKNLRNKQAAGTYDSEKAHKAFQHATKDASDRYHKAHGHRFSVATRKAVAAKMRDEFEADSKAGEHDHLLHKKHKGHKVESVQVDEGQTIKPTSKSHLKSLVKQGRAKALAAAKEKEETKSKTDEAIKYDSAGDSTGTVTGKGKRDRGPGGTVTVQYKGSDTYKDGAKMPIKARDMGRLLKQARKSGTTPYDSRNLKNPRLTKDHVEHEVDEAVKPALRMGVDFKYKAPSEAEKTVMKQEKEKAAKMRSTPDTSAAGRAAQRMIDARKKTEESVELDLDESIVGRWRRKSREGFAFTDKEQKLRDKKKDSKAAEPKTKKESVELDEGPAHQNPRVTAFGGMKAAQDTPSFKKYQARLKAEREARKREFERDQAAKKGTREEVEVDEAMGGNLKDVRKQAVKNQKKRRKGEKLAKKDHDGDGKIETGSQEFLGSRDRAIKAAIAARRGN